MREALPAVPRCHPRPEHPAASHAGGVAVVVAFLATAEPLFMTGEVIDVDGGADIN